MDDQALRIIWMRAVLRLHARGSVAAWPDAEVVETFAALAERPLPFEVWAARVGYSQAPADPAPADETDPDVLVSVIQGNSPNVTVERHERVDQ
jgi:hypothetical protein